MAIIYIICALILPILCVKMIIRGVKKNKNRYAHDTAVLVVAITAGCFFYNSTTIYSLLFGVNLALLSALAIHLIWPSKSVQTIVAQDGILNTQNLDGAVIHAPSYTDDHINDSTRLISTMSDFQMSDFQSNPAYSDLCCNIHYHSDPSNSVGMND